MATVQDYHLTRAHALAYLDRQCGGGCASTLYLAPGMTLESVESHIRAAIGRTPPPGLVDAAQSSRTGGCLFWGNGLSLVVPPFPVRERAIFGGCEIGPLESMLREDKTIAVVLVRLGAYAVGVCVGERLLTSKVGTGLVHSRQRQGGSSAQRFRRRRERQIEEFLARICGKVGEHVGVYLRDVDFVVYGGARTTIELFKKRCAILSPFADRELPPLLDIGQPKQAILEAVVRRVWSCRIIEWEGYGDVG